MSSHVWYASYGSNLSRHRFEHYLHGGTPVGGRRHHPGARDRTPPAEDRPFHLPWRLRFGGASRTWGGGMAFVDITERGRTLARMYRLRAGQFADVHAQENGGNALPTDIGALRPGTPVRAGGGNYPLLVCCGHIDGVPVVTFTSDTLPRRVAPATAYLRTIAAGLAESHCLNPTAIARYLRGSPAVRAAYDEDTLAAVASAGVAAAIVPPPRHSSPS
jgi:hypothetical protein